MTEQLAIKIIVHYGDQNQVTKAISDNYINYLSLVPTEKLIIFNESETI